MMWKTPRPDEIRIVRKFLLWPRSHNGITRWLEFAYIREHYAEHHGFWRESIDVFATEDEYKSYIAKNPSS
jgi:hypothetical protein